MMLEEAAVGGMIGRLLGVDDSNRSILQGASTALRRSRHSKVEEEVKNEYK